MTAISDNQHLAGMINDYLNGHLSQANENKIEHAIKTDPAFAEQVALERRIQSTIVADRETPTATIPFSTLEKKLGTGNRSFSFFQWGLPLAASMVVAVVTITSITDKNGIDDDSYETLSDDSMMYHKPLLRIVGTSDISTADLEQLASDYSLKIVRSFPATNAIDVEAAGNASLSDLLADIEDDRRVRFVRMQESSQ